MEKIMSLNFGTSFMSIERETESCKVFVGFVLPSTWISNLEMTYINRAMGHYLWMDGWIGWMEKTSQKTTTTSFTICNSNHYNLRLSFSKKKKRILMMFIATNKQTNPKTPQMAT
jgi:hypothetical protein